MSAKRTCAAASVATLALTAAHAQDPYEKPDESWISLSGTVSAAGNEVFTLDYGEGLITVEMDDWDRYGEARFIAPGESIAVFGRIDDSFYEARTIEADSVYVAERNTYFYANDADEEGDLHYRYAYTYYPTTAEEGSWVTVSGPVKSISGRELTLDTGVTEIQVDTDRLKYNPLDDTGYQQIDVGDRIAVYGEVDDDLFEQREIMARTLTSFDPGDPEPDMDSPSG